MTRIRRADEAGEEPMQRKPGVVELRDDDFTALGSGARVSTAVAP